MLAITILQLCTFGIYSSLMNPLQFIPGSNTKAPVSAMEMASQIQPMPLQAVRPLNGIATSDLADGESASDNVFVRRIWTDGYSDDFDYDYEIDNYDGAYRFNNPYF